MTDPRQSAKDERIKPEDDREPEVEVELVKDLDVDDRQVSQVRGGSGRSHFE